MISFAILHFLASHLAAVREKELPKKAFVTGRINGRNPEMNAIGIDATREQGIMKSKSNCTEVNLCDVNLFRVMEKLLMQSESGWQSCHKMDLLSSHRMMKFQILRVQQISSFAREAR